MVMWFNLTADIIHILVARSYIANGIAVCKIPSAEIACDSLISPSNGNVVVDGSGVGTVATYSCDTGYTLEGVSMRTCQNSADPTWSGSPPSCNSELVITYRVKQIIKLLTESSKSLSY